MKINKYILFQNIYVCIFSFVKINFSGNYQNVKEVYLAEYLPSFSASSILLERFSLEFLHSCGICLNFIFIIVIVHNVP